MMISWWWMWMVVMLLFWMLPMGYGWGYRGWGPPYPRYVQRRRGARAAASGDSATNHQAWGWGGDFVWIVLLFGAFWAVASLWWWR